MSLARATAVILAKELRTEFRSRELLGTTLVFVLIVIVLFSFTFNPTSPESRRFGPGLLWLAFLFAGSLMLQPSFVREQTNDTLAALRLAPDRSVQHSGRKDGGKFSVSAAGGSDPAAGVRGAVQHGDSSGAGAS